MKMDYSNLWKLLIDKKLKKKDLAALAGLSPSTISKIAAGANVNTGILIKICTALDCRLNDIAEITNEET
ncbi:MAG: helix-turn-helix domain-containing protein [Schwartzia sp. (in: firmicutes)]